MDKIDAKKDTLHIDKATYGYSTRHLHSAVNNICTCNKPEGLVGGGYCYAKDELGNIVRPCDIGVSLNDIMNNADIKG